MFTFSKNNGILLAMHTMKNFYIILLIFLLSSAIFPKDLIKAGVYSGYFSPRDEILNEIYAGKDVIYGLKTGIHIWKGFYAYLSAMQYRQVAESPLGDVTRLRLNPLTLSLRYTFSLGVANPYLESGFTQIYFKEVSDIGNTTDSGSGFSLNAGIEFRASDRFIFDLGAKYSQVKVSPGVVEVELGGFQAGISFLVVL
jgi:hypothetical protein